MNRQENKNSDCTHEEKNVYYTLMMIDTSVTQRYLFM